MENYCDMRILINHVIFISGLFLGSEFLVAKFRIFIVDIYSILFKLVSHSVLMIIQIVDKLLITILRENQFRLLTLVYLFSVSDVEVEETRPEPVVNQEPPAAPVAVQDNTVTSYYESQPAPVRYVYKHKSCTVIQLSHTCDIELH